VFDWHFLSIVLCISVQFHVQSLLWDPLLTPKVCLCHPIPLLLWCMVLTFICTATCWQFVFGFLYCSTAAKQAIRRGHGGHWSRLSHRRGHCNGERTLCTVSKVTESCGNTLQCDQKGHALSPLLFNFALEYAIGRVQQTRRAWN